MPRFFRTVEYSRGMEALTNLGNARSAMNRCYLFSNSYTPGCVTFGNLDIDDPYDAHGKADAEISVDGIVLFTGTLELVSCEIADHQPISYEVIFYGETKQILTEFGEDTLRDVTYGTNMVMSYTNIASSWSGSYQSGDVVFPVFDYGGSESKN